MNNKISKINLNHSLLFFLIINLLTFVCFYLQVKNISPIICLSFILTLGISHGALDNYKGKKLFKIFNIDKFIFFYPTYVSIGIAIIVLWLIFPLTTFLIFLLIASYHFGKEDTQFLITKENSFIQLLYLIKGILIILAPLHFHFNETINIFKFLFIENEVFFSLLGILEQYRIIVIGIVISSLSSVYFFIKNYNFNRTSIILDYFSILLLNFYFEPLTAFTVYFCFLHSIRHIISLANELDSTNIKKGLNLFWKKCLPLTIITILFFGLAFYWLINQYSLDNVIFKLIFIGLASLTFPHILLEYFLEKNERKTN